MEINWNKLHHAYLISGCERKNLWLLIEKETGFAKTGNPDALDLEMETFGIDDSRELYLWSIKKPFNGERKIAVVSGQSFTTEAQNALLKIFEEPPLGTHFFILAQNRGAMLPTLLSRMNVLVFSEEKSQTAKTKEFLASGVSGRLKMVASIIKNKDKKKAIEFVSAVAAETRGAGLDSKKEALPVVLNALKFLSGRSPSIKMILEHLALSLPEIHPTSSSLRFSEPNGPPSP